MEQRFKDFGYTKIYPKLTKEYKEQQPELFEMGILIAKQQEAEKGMYAHRQYKPNKFGSKIYFRYRESEQQLEEYRNKLNKAADILIKNS